MRFRLPMLWSGHRSTTIEHLRAYSTSFDAAYVIAEQRAELIISPPAGKRRVLRTRGLDAAARERTNDPSLSRPAAYGRWLLRQLPAATIDPDTVRIRVEATVTLKGGRDFATMGLRLNGLLRFDDPRAMAVGLLRGVGRRRAYGCGLLVLA